MSTGPWVTAAETAECALALDALGRKDEAMDLLNWAQMLRCEDGSYWTGMVFPEQTTFPFEERTTYTAGGDRSHGGRHRRSNAGFRTLSGRSPSDGTRPNGSLLQANISV